MIGHNAVVVGASMAGLCAARVLSERFERVLLVDRDTLPDGAEPRMSDTPPTRLRIDFGSPEFRAPSRFRARPRRRHAPG
jgi:predicted NAD/FAD-dependent oxidoreductase